jgi:2-polyprenyl-6-methoxyphenol hydroxylase-like FAD-dependent oxidoreductase
VTLSGQASRLSPRTVSARVLLAADGLAGTCLAADPRFRPVVSPASRIGAGAITADAPAGYGPGTIHMACGGRGYLGMVRLEDGRLDLAAALDPALVRDVGSLGGAAAAILREVGWPAVPGVETLPWRGTPRLTRNAPVRAADGIFLLGDAAGYVEPFTGEGMAWALASGVAVAPLAKRAARRPDPALAAEWEAVYRRTVAARQVACRAVADVLRRPGLARAVIRVLTCVPSIATPVLNHLNRPPRQGAATP